MKLNPLSGDPGEWDDWSFAFKRTIRRMRPATFTKMNEAEQMTDEIDEVAELEKEFEVRSGELYDALCQFCQGNAMSIVRSVDDMEGMRAWQRLHKWYNPRTMSRGVRLLCEVTNPPKIKEMKDIETHMNKWEEKVKVLEKQFKETLSNNMRIAIYTNMLPMTIQDYIYTNVGKETKFEDLKEKIKSMVGNKLAADSGPTPMDIGVI